MPTAGAIAAAIGGAVRGTVFDLFIDNQLGAALGIATITQGGDTTIATTAAGAIVAVAPQLAGVGRFTFMFTSATTCVLSRTA